VGAVRRSVGGGLTSLGLAVGAGAAIAAVLVLPLLLFARVAVHTVESDITDRAASSSLSTAAVIAHNLDDALRDVGERLTLLTARPSAIEVIRRKDAAGRHGRGR